MDMSFAIDHTDYRVRLRLVWQTDDHRAARAEALRITALVKERSSSERWCVDVPAGIGILGHGRLGGSVEIELADGSDAEAGRAEVLLQQVAAEWQGR